MFASHKFRRAQGFTLIELMVVVGIIGILVAIAMPAYNDYLRKGRRAEAQAQLMNLAQQEEQYFLDARAYALAASALNVTIPTSVSTYYTITFVTTDGPPPTFSISATPIGDQAKDSCGTLTITSAGTKSASTGATCW